MKSGFQLEKQEETEFGNHVCMYKRGVGNVCGHEPAQRVDR